MTDELRAAVANDRAAFSTHEMAAIPSDVVTLYLVQLAPLELVFNTKPITSILGYTPDDLMAMDMATVNRLIHPDDALGLAAHIARIATLADGEIAEFRHRMRAVSGDWVWIEVRDAVHLRDAAGNPVQVIGTAREVTDEMRNAEALRSSEARHRLLSETMLQGVVHHAADGSIIAINPAAERILGRPRETFIGSYPQQEERNTIHLDGSPFQGHEHPANVAQRTGEPQHGVVMGVYNHDSQEYRWISIDAVPLLRRGERVPYEVYTVFEDITNRLRAEQALREEHARKDRFIATLAHELRNPLAPIRSAVVAQQRRASGDPELAWTQAIIERQVGLMARLLDDLLDASRIASGKLELRREHVLLSAVLAQSVETARPVIEAAGHTVTVNQPAGDVHLDGDAIRIAQVVSNLLTNAAKYTEPGGQITLTATVHDAMLTLRVTDTGIGIAPQHLSQIFEMFGQVHDALDRSQGGLGIGLSLARSLVELHGGSIAVHSDGLGMGTEFVVRLPASAISGADVDAPEPEVAPPAAASARRLVVVDDNRDGCDSLAAVLEMYGCDVATAYDGPQGIAMTASHQPEVVLLDVGLPGMNGYETCRAMRDLPRGDELVILAVTGWGTDEDIRRAAAAGFDAHLVKPIDMTYLRHLLALPRHEVQRAHQVRLMREGRAIDLYDSAPRSRGQST